MKQPPHLEDDALAALATSTADEARPAHLAECAACRSRLAWWQGITDAVRTDEAARTAAAPSFDALVAPALTPPTAPQPQPVLSTAPHRPSPARTLRLAGQLVQRQAKLLPRAWAPLSAAGLLAAALLAPLLGDPSTTLRAFSAAAVLVLLLGALLVSSPRTDPRHELMHTLPTSPTSVFLARTTAVLTLDLLLALGCSALLGDLGWWTAVSGWLGQGLLASTAALALSLRLGAATGASAGAAIWLLSVLTGPDGLLTSPLAVVLDPLLTTSWWTLALSALLLAWAVRQVRRSSDTPAEPA
ncbi:hypothetical protein [Streptomyces xiaopingdaonensis]|uniref:hypothetical protein n=1 Tax=Streptomyces xiaopingdaonensis TaxID=1565415 RepID=UPI00031415CE|nr:hypothetical protein [Streptomyces xiaopingdaonensis]